jgi:hypothetical protein
MEINILASDVLFHTSPDAGEKDCICSRCLKQITEEQAPVIRCWQTDEQTGEMNGTEYRFHISCLEND